MKTKINTSVDTLDVLDRNYDRKYEDLQKRLDAVYDKISDAEDLVYEFSNPNSCANACIRNNSVPSPTK